MGGVVPTSLQVRPNNARAQRRCAAVTSCRVRTHRVPPFSTLGRQGTQLEPDRSAANHRFDMAATEVVYRRCQELGVSLVVLTRSAAYAA
eukprot:4768972-Prymnesium_polylepis.1